MVVKKVQGFLHFHQIFAIFDDFSEFCSTVLALSPLEKLSNTAKFLEKMKNIFQLLHIISLKNGCFCITTNFHIDIEESSWSLFLSKNFLLSCEMKMKIQTKLRPHLTLISIEVCGRDRLKMQYICIAAHSS